MKTLSIVVLVLACAAGAAAFGPQDKPAKAIPSLTGKWTMSLDMAMGTATPALELKQDGAKLTGSYTGRYGTFPLQGSLKDRTIVFTFTMTAEGETVTMSFTGEVAEDGQSMKGTATLGEMGDATWSAKRDKGERPAPRP